MTFSNEQDTVIGTAQLDMGFLPEFFCRQNQTAISIAGKNGKFFTM